MIFMVATDQASPVYINSTLMRKTLRLSATTVPAFLYYVREDVVLVSVRCIQDSDELDAYRVPVVAVSLLGESGRCLFMGSARLG